jgi:hypothetical protein
VSWIFSFLLACYLLVRVVLRVRGQLRWLAIRDTLPVPPPPVEAPSHLPPALGELFVDSRELRVALVEARRTLTAVEITDPDAPLGRVRDARYRRALMQSWTKINTWLRAARELDEHAAARLADMHLGTEAIERLRDSLARPWREVSRARALDLFELEDLLAVRHTLERIEAELDMIERGLERLGDDPYRDRFVDIAAAS